MSVIINNSATADENAIRIHDPLIYVGDPSKGKPLDGGQLYFGVVGLDPQLPEHQKTVYAIQEDQSVVPMEQPVIIGAGGYPTYNGTVVSLAVNGSYSYKVLDKNGAQQYFIPRVDATNLNGYSGVIVEESRTVSSNAVADFVNIEATTATFYASENPTVSEFNGRLMRIGVDYSPVSTTEILLLTAYPDNTVILGRQMDPTGQTVSSLDLGESLIIFKTITDAYSSNIQVDQTVSINGGAAEGDGLGGLRYVCVTGGTGTDDGENFINLENGNQLKLIANNMKLQRYSETVASASSVAGNLNLDLEQSSVFEVTLTESVSNILFLNANNGSRTVTLKITQAAVGGFGVSFSGIKWANGVEPTVSVAGDSVDVFVFTTFDGVEWIGSSVGQSIS